MHATARFSSVALIGSPPVHSFGGTRTGRYAADQTRHVGPLRRKGSKISSVFVSYTAKDASEAHRLARDLARHGIHAWLGECDIVASSGTEAPYGLAATDYLLVLISKNSMASTAMQRELEGVCTADPTSASPHIVPVRLDRTALPPRLSNISCLDLTSDYDGGVRLLVRTLAEPQSNRSGAMLGERRNLHCQRADTESAPHNAANPDAGNTTAGLPHDVDNAAREPEVDSALAKVGRELIAAPNTPALLEAFCRLTAELLACDFSCTLLWCAADEAYVPAACYGATPEEWEAMRVLKLSRESMSVFLEQLERAPVVQTASLPNTPTAAALLRSAYDVWQSAVVALHQGKELIGFHCAGYRGRPGVFTAPQLQIMHGTAQLASLALERTRLVEELREASTLKSEFVATMSHELRTPLNIILGYTDLLLEQAFGALAPEQAESLQRIEKSGRELLELINATLDLSRLEAGRMTLDVRETYVPDLLHQVEVETRPLQHKPRFNFVLHVSPSLPPLHTDPLKLKVILKNLVVNALKFTDEGSVMVDVYCREGGLEFCVADTGIGMPPEALSIIFEPFRQAHGFKTRRQGGVGLGLYIVRRLVEMMGGSISVDSELGRGSIFRVWLPNQIQSGAGRSFNA